jgi:hypothetical protein
LEGWERDEDEGEGMKAAADEVERWRGMKPPDDDRVGGGVCVEDVREVCGVDAWGWNVGAKGERGFDASQAGFGEGSGAFGEVELGRDAETGGVRAVVKTASGGGRVKCRALDEVAATESVVVVGTGDELGGVGRGRRLLELLRGVGRGRMWTDEVDEVGFEVELDWWGFGRGRRTLEWGVLHEGSSWLVKAEKERLRRLELVERSRRQGGVEGGRGRWGSEDSWLDPWRMVSARELRLFVLSDG